MAGHTTHLVFHMTALNAPDVRRLIQVAGEADAVRFPRLEFRGVPDIGGGNRFRVFAARPVTGFASPGFKSALLIFLHHLVWALLKCVGNVLMARLTDFRAGILSRLVLPATKSGGEQQGESGKEAKDLHRTLITALRLAALGRVSRKKSN